MELDKPSNYNKVPKGTLIAGHFKENDDYSTSRAEGINDWLMTYTLEGEGQFIVEGEDYRVKAGDLSFVKPGVSHYYGTAKEKQWEFVWVHFSQGLIDVHLLPLENLVIYHFDQNVVRERILQAFGRITADFREQGDLWHELCLGALHEIILLFAKQKNSRVDPRVEEVLYILAERMHESLTIKEISLSIGLSVSRLQHLYKENTGETVIETLNRMRIKQACYLLTHTKLTASEAAYNVGFQNYNHFTRQFQRFIGLSPREFCQTIRQPSE